MSAPPTAIRTDPAVLRILYRSAVTTMTETEIREQRISWVMGKTGATREHVEDALNYAGPAPPARK